MSNLLALIKLRSIYEIEIFLGLIKLNIFSNEEIGKFLVKKKKMRLRITLTWCVSISVDSADTMSAYTQLVHDTKRNSENQKLIHVVL